MRHLVRTLRRPGIDPRPGLVILLPIIAAIVAACGNRSGGSAY